LTGATPLTREFLFAFLGLFSFTTGFHALFPTLPIYLEKLGADTREIGILVGVMGISSLFSRLIVGGMLRIYSEKRVMMVGASIFAITFLGLLVLRPFWPIFTVRTLQGIAFACVDTAALAFVVRTTAVAVRGQVIGYFVLAPTFTTAIAPVGAMFTVNKYGFNSLFLSCFALAMCSFFFASRLTENKASKTPFNQNLSLPGSVLFNRRIVLPSITSFLKSFVYGALVAFFPLYAVECGVQNPGYFFTANALVLIAGRILAGNIVDAYDKEKIILVCISMATVSMIILSFSRTLSLFILVGMIWGAGNAFFFPASMAYALEYAGSADGPALGTFRAISDLGSSLGPVIMGLVVPFTGYNKLFLLLAFICLMNLCHFHSCVRQKRKNRVSSSKL
jgi:MFS family permease